MEMFHGCITVKYKCCYVLASQFSEVGNMENLSLTVLECRRRKKIAFKLALNGAPEFSPAIMGSHSLLLSWPVIRI